MTRDELIEWQNNERAFVATPIGSAFDKFKKRLIEACYYDAKIKFTDHFNEKTRREFWDRADKAEKELRKLLEQHL